MLLAVPLRQFAFSVGRLALRRPQTGKPKPVLFVSSFFSLAGAFGADKGGKYVAVERDGWDGFRGERIVSGESFLDLQGGKTFVVAG